MKETTNKCVLSLSQQLDERWSLIKSPPFFLVMYTTEKIIKKTIHKSHLPPVGSEWCCSALVHQLLLDSCWHSMLSLGSKPEHQPQINTNHRPCPVINILWNLGRYELAGKLFSFLPGGQQEFSNGHIKCYEISRHTHRSCWSVLHFTAEERVSWQNTERVVSCDMHDFCTYFFEMQLAVMHWTKLWCVLMILNTYSSNLVCLSDTLVTNLVHMASI